MKVTVAWGAKNDGLKFTLKAADLEGVLGELSARDEWGQFTGDYSYDSKGDSAGIVSSVVLKPSYKILMPSWPAAGKQPKTCQDEFKRMCGVLLQHEKGHQKVFEDGIKAAVSKLEALDPATQKDVDDIITQMGKDIQAAHNKYDAGNKHGASQGVKLDIDEECASPE
jgi:predicted secreted Zn-dependent protease